MNTFVEEDTAHHDIGFEQFLLQPGVELNLHNENGKPLPHKAQFVMAYPGTGVLVSLQTSDPRQVALLPNAACRVSGFNGSFDFSFTSRVRKVDPLQLTAMLEAPKTVRLHFVRKYPRTEMTLPAMVSLPRETESRPVTIRNLSVGGAAFTSDKPLGNKGEPLLLQLQVMFEQRKEPIRLSTIVRRCRVLGESPVYETAVEFANPSRMDKLLLHYFLGTQARRYALI